MNHFTVAMDNKEHHRIDGESIEEIFMKIDGLRLQGKRWLKVYNYDDDVGSWDVYVNIDHIVSIEEI